MSVSENRDQSTVSTEASVSSLTVELDVPMAMRDGVILRADIYRPETGAWPVLLSRTPYSKSFIPGILPALNPVRAARAGFALVIQDTRGRFESEGDFYPFAAEADDGLDSIRWVARQPWSSGRVGMFGSSYMGATQLQAAVTGPSELIAMCPVQASSDYFEGRSYRGGAFELGALVSIALWALGPGTLQRTMGRASTLTKFRAAREVMGQLDDFLSTLPLESLRETILGEVAPFFFDWLEHDRADEYWRSISVEEHHDKITAAALHITSWFDQYHVGSLRNFEGIRAKSASKAVRDSQSLLVGPWTHYAPKTGLLGSVRVGEVDFGLSALLDLETIQHRWFTRWLKNEPDAWTGRSPVRLFVMGHNKWRDEEDWPLARAEARPLYLGGSGGSGRLAWSSTRSEVLMTYNFDPADPVPTRGGAHLVVESLYPQGPVDQRALEGRSDVLVFTSERLEQSIEVTGWVNAELFVSSSAPTTDFTVKLIDVWPDGRALNVCDGIRRVRFGEVPRSGDWTRVDVELGATSMVFEKGHALRVHISSSNFPRFDVNPNTGEPRRTATSQTVARQTICVGGNFCSRVVLPVIEGPTS